MKWYGIFLIALMMCSLAFADSIPNYMSIQGRLMNATNSSIQGTNTVTFKIYNASSGGTSIYSSSQSITTSSDGIFNAYLTAMNLSFDMPYFLGITVSGNAEMVPRHNITSTPFCYRANISDFLNPNSTIFTQLGALQSSNASAYVLIGVLNTTKGQVGNCPTGEVVQNITSTGPECIATGGSGTVTSITQGTGMNFSSNPITSTGTINLNFTKVINGTYGGATDVARYTVDSTGRLNASSNVSILIGNANINDVSWAKLTNFPSACSAGNAVTAVGASLTCSPFLTSFTETDPLWSANFSNFSSQILRLISSNGSIYTSLNVLNLSEQADNATLGGNLSNNWTYIQGLGSATDVANNLSANWTYIKSLNNNATNIANNLSANWTYSINLNINATNNWTNQSLIDGNLTNNWTYSIALNNNATASNGRLTRLESSNASIFSLVGTLNATTIADNTTIFNRITNTTNVLNGVNFTNATGFAPINFSITNNGIIVNTTRNLPACDANRRGGYWIIQNSNGNPDYVMWCLKNSTDAYNWIQAAIG